MRQPFAHEAIVFMDSDGDLRAPGAAITVELCGHWEHEPPCPLAPHHTSAERTNQGVHLRTLFVVEPAREAEVRERIRVALRAGRMVAPDDRETRWHLVREAPAGVRPEEADHANRLLAG